jgi:hypothetical protein
VLVLSISTPVCAQTAATKSGAVSTSAAVSLVNVSDPPSTSGDPTTHVITPPTVVAPGLAAAGVETCLGSSSGGISLMGGGITFSSTKVDEGCTIRLLARQLFAFGFHNAAMALMCEDEHVIIAMSEVGKPCPPGPILSGPGEPMSLLPPSWDREESTGSDAQDPQVKPFTAQEAALFARISVGE